ncbi:ubiquitin-protein ligase-like, putative, partial [Trypanosoma cruzi marinkellei]
EEDPHGRNGERDGRTQTSAHESPSHSQSQQWEEAPDDSNMIDQCGRCAYGQPPGSAPHSSQSVPSLPSSQTLTQDPFLMPIAPRKRGRRKEEPREEEEEEGTRGTVIICEEDEEELVTQSVPPPPSSHTNQQALQGLLLNEEEEDEIPMRERQPQREPQEHADEITPRQQPTPSPNEKEGEEEEGVGDEEGEVPTPRQNTTGQDDRGHPFSHDKTNALLDP